MPFNSEEFGKLLLEENNLNEVIIEETPSVDHYDLNDKVLGARRKVAEKEPNFSNNNMSRNWTCYTT